MSMDIEAVVFDLGNVLVDVVHERAAAALRSCCAQGPQRLRDAITRSPLLSRLETGDLDSHGFYAALLEHADMAIGFDAFCAAFCDIFTPVTRMIEAHAALRERGMPTYLFSNTSELHFAHLRQTCGFLSDFDGRILSYELRCMKPDAPIYEAVEARARLRGRQLLYVDDRMENVEAGARRGWQVIHHVAPADTVARLRALGVL